MMSSLSTGSPPSAAAAAAAAEADSDTAAASAPAVTPAEGTNHNKDTSNSNNKQPNAIEFEPPLACVRRILKNSLPSSTNVGKDASAAFARACGIFIIYLTACANDMARENKVRTLFSYVQSQIASW
jgi:histone H3/H4